MSETVSKPCLLLGSPVHPISPEEVVEVVAKLIRSRTRPAAYIVQTNVYSLVTAEEQHDYREVLARATLSVPDGMPLVWMLRRKGFLVQNRVYGPDLMLQLCERAVQEGWRCFLCGGGAGVAEQAKKMLTKRYPGLNIVGTASPILQMPFTHDNSTLIDGISRSKPDIVWVGLGSPKQDYWMSEVRNMLDTSVLHGVGAAFDFHFQRMQQAPRWMMRAGLEWLFRLIVEPRRLWQRYTIINLKFLWYTLRYRLRGGPDSA